MQGKGWRSILVLLMVKSTIGKKRKFSKENFHRILPKRKLRFVDCVLQFSSFNWQFLIRQVNRSKAKDILEVNRPAWNQSVFIEGAVKCVRQNRQMSAVSVHWYCSNLRICRVLTCIWHLTCIAYLMLTILQYDPSLAGQKYNYRAEKLPPKNPQYVPTTSKFEMSEGPCLSLVAFYGYLLPLLW